MTESTLFPLSLSCLLLFGCGPTHPAEPSSFAQLHDDSRASLRAAYIETVQGAALPHHNAQIKAKDVLLQSPEQRLRAQVSASGITLTDADQSFSSTLAVRALSCQRTKGEPLHPDVNANRVVLRRAAFEEWYVSGPLGIEQGFTIFQPPSCGDRVFVDLELSGDLSLGPCASSRDAVCLYDARGKIRLRYTDLFARDAAGQRLPARMVALSGTLRLEVDDAGARYPIVIDPLIWTQEQKLTALDGRIGDYFGLRVALSGDTALISAQQADVAGKRDAGAAYVFVRSGSTWTQQAKLTPMDAAADDNFGHAVALSGDTALIGAPAAAVSGKVRAGAAYVFVRSGGTWTEQAKLTASDGTGGDQIGYAVALSGDTAVASSPFVSDAVWPYSGAAYVYVRSGGVWTEQAKLTESAPRLGDYYGETVAALPDTVAVGASALAAGSARAVGAVFVYTRSGTTWTRTAQLVPSPVAEPELFGKAIGLSPDGMIVGASSASSGGLNTGVAYVFTRSAGVWTQQARLEPTAGAGGDSFGSGVALAGDLASVGAPSRSSGRISGSGSIFLFQRTGGVWAQKDELFALDGAASDSLGNSVAMNSDLIIGGASGADPGGAAYSFALAMPLGEGSSCARAAECASGFCADGVCCDTACGDSANDCQVCRKALGASADGKCTPRPNTVMCRASAGICDVAEYCDGTSGTCPPDALQPATMVCRSAVSACDAAEHCTGASVLCPYDWPLPASSVCRPASGPCDVAEVCDGTSKSCPNDAVAPSSKACRAVAGLCDVAEFCSGSAKTCPIDKFEPATKVCRSAAGVCDVAESCTGAAAACPPDNFEPATKVCRSAAGPCDVAESCSGAAAACPSDVLRTAGSKCQDGSGGPCDLDDVCNGTSITCPERVAPATTVCRGASQECDITEYCSGLGKACASDLFKADGTGCSSGSCQSGQCRPETDLAITLSATPTVASRQKPVWIQSQVIDTGKSSASQVVLRITVQKDADVKQVESADWACQTSANTVTCSRSPVGSGSVPAVAVLVVPPLLETRFSVDASVASQTFDLNLLNNNASLEIKNQSPCATACPDSDPPPPSPTPVSSDGGTSSEPMDNGGCHCSLAGRSSAPASLPLCALLLPLALLRRRRRLPEIP